jgi:hypothetical protein
MRSAPKKRRDPFLSVLSQRAITESNFISPIPIPRTVSAAEISKKIKSGFKEPRPEKTIDGTRNKIKYQR